MRNTVLMIAALGAVALGAACQSQQNVNANTASNSNANTVDHSQHDMSNMNGHDMSKMPGMNANMQMTSAPGAAEQPFDLPARLGEKVGQAAGVELLLPRDAPREQLPAARLEAPVQARDELERLVGEDVARRRREAPADGDRLAFEDGGRHRPSI